MSYSPYIPGDDHGRVCDVCGRLRPGRGFRVADGVWICDRHPSYVPHQTLDKVPYRALGAPASIPNAKPWNPIDTYEIPEAQVLNLVTACAPAESLDVTNGAGTPITTTATQYQAAAWTSLYLYDLIVEAKRPARWVTLARAVLGILGDYLYTAMKGGPGVVGFTNVDLQWGAFNRVTVGEDYFAEDSGAAGLALLRAYQVLGTAKYLTGARACAWFIRGAQCGDKLVSRPSTSDSAGASPKHFGAWTHRVLLGGTYDFDHRYYPSDLIALEFLGAFRGVAGDEVIGSPTTTAVFSGSRAATVSTAITEALAFWTTPTWSVDDGALVNGLSSATPREFFDAYPAAKGGFTGRGSWQLQDGALATGTLITSRSWAVGLRALRVLSGDAAVTSLFDWLMTFTSNPAFEATATSHIFGQVTYTDTAVDERARFAGLAGTYDPKTALATLLQVRSAGAAIARNGSSLYDLAAVGLLAPLYSARQLAPFGLLKDALEVPRPRWRQGFEPRDGQYLWLGPLGICGLALQPYTDASLNRTQSITRAAQLGGIYRCAPQAWTGRGH